MQFITSSISTMLVLLLLGMVVFFMLTANNLSVYVRENIGITLVLSDDMKESSIIAFQKQLEKKNYIKEATYISKAEALKEQTQAMGTDPVEFLGHNPFTASLELKLAADYATTDSIAWIEQELRRSNKYIMEVNYPQEFESVSFGIGRFTDSYFVCIDKQYHTPYYLFKAFSYSHHEAGGCQLVVYTPAFHGA